MNDPTGRVLQLLSLLQTHKFWPGGELADRLEVSARTLRRDVDRLRELGYPVDATPGVAGGYRLAAGAHMPPLLLDDDEAVAIAVGLRSAAGASVAGIEDTSLRAMAKLEQVLPDRLRRRVTAVHANVVPLRWAGTQAPTIDAEALATLAQACRDHEEVRFEYRRRDGDEARRLVEPHQLVSAGRRWYLAAYDLRRDDWRTFRVDRISELRPAGARFTPRPLPGGDAAAYVAQSLGSVPTPYEATATVHGPRDAVAGLVSWSDARVDEVAPGTCRAQLKAETLEGLVTVVTVLAANYAVEVPGPPALLAALDRVAARLAAAGPAGTAQPAAG
jgi:predicted DNA-binding transcriptional regulator YafY